MNKITPIICIVLLTRTNKSFSIHKATTTIARLLGRRFIHTKVLPQTYGNQMASCIRAQRCMNPKGCKCKELEAKTSNQDVNEFWRKIAIEYDIKPAGELSGGETARIFAEDHLYKDLA